MRILHLFFTFSLGGAELMLIDIINKCVDRDKVSLLIINDKYDPSLIERLNPKVKVSLLKRRQGSKNILDLLRLNWMVLKFNPQIIHCHESNIIKYFFVRRLMKTILTVHDTNLSLVGAEDYNKVVAISKAVQCDILKRKAVSSKLNYNGVDVKSIARKENKTNSIEAFRVVQIGRLEFEKKGQDLLLQAVAFIKEKYPQINITIDYIGVGGSMQALENMAIQFGLANRVNLLGARDRLYIYNHLKDYDLLVQPSLFEGFGLTVVEAMVAGLPVLVSDIDGPKEIINDGEYGFLFKSNNINDLANKLIYLINNPQKRLSVAELGQEYACDNFYIEKTVENYENIYEELSN